MADDQVSQPTQSRLSVAALASAVLGALAFFVGGPVNDSFWALGALISAAAVVLGLLARRRETAGRKMATVGLVLGAIVVAWFLIYVLLAMAGVVED